MVTNRFAQSSLMTTSAEGYHDVWGAKFANLRYAVPYTKTFTVRAGYEANLPAIADLELGDQHMWWILLQYNGLFDPIHDIRIGQELRIPDRTALISYLERATTSGIRSVFSI